MWTLPLDLRICECEREQDRRSKANKTVNELETIGQRKRQTDGRMGEIREQTKTETDK